MKISKFETNFAGKILTLEIGALAYQANAAVRAQYGDTVVLVTAVMGKQPREGVDYLPLTIDFEEKFYAAGRIKGSRWIKREGRPTDEAILTDRLIDRTLRPLFNQRLRHEVQLVVTVLSFDGENDPDVPAIIASSTALVISDIPWAGPVGAVRVAQDDQGFIFNPTYEQRKTSSFDLVLAGSNGLFNMIEARGDQVAESTILEAAKAAQKHLDDLIKFQKEVGQKIGQPKIEIETSGPNEKLRKELRTFLGRKLEDALYGEPQKNELMEAVVALKKETLVHFDSKHPDDKSLGGEFDLLFEEELDSVIHKNILQLKKRPDGRAFDEIRSLKADISVLPRTHGTGLFQRGNTQALSILTLGAPGLEQSVETMEFVGTKRFMHHYNFPPFSTGETGRMGSSKRREIGHGALAEKALEPVIPEKEDFPYVLRIVTEILSSHGSTSMASVCGSSLALMDAGVPVKEAVAGIAMGLMIEDEKNPAKNYIVLTDIQGPEDHHGDMDLKVAGTKNGITALQMDVKIAGVTPDILMTVLEQAKKARLEILKTMNQTIAEPREKLSSYAPHIITIRINPQKIGDVIGPGGKIINKITSETGVTIDIEEDGLVFITSPEGEAGAQEALKRIKSLTHEVAPGEVFEGKVKRILAFGAFVEILPGQQGLIHISELAPWRVEKVEDVVKVGDGVRVKVKNIDTEGRINLTMKEFQKNNDSSLKTSKQQHERRNKTN